MVNMQDTSTAKTWTLMSSTKNSSGSGGSIIRFLTEINSRNENYLYAGKTNYLNLPNLPLLDLDWTGLETPVTYGFFEV
jgi:hypothetical protein